MRHEAIDYRCWHKKEKRMFKVTTLNMMNNEYWEPTRKMGTTSYHYFKAKDVIPMMFTSWGDKNRKRVYEKDILYDGKNYYIVNWDYRGFFLIEPELKTHHWFTEMKREKNVFEELELAGNIFENAHLVEN